MDAAPAHAPVFDNVLHDRRRRIDRRLLVPVGQVLVVAAAWAVAVLPVVTWLAAGAALVHVIERGVRRPDARVLHEFAAGWRRHWRTTVPLGVAGVVVAAVLTANLLFLTGRSSGGALVLAVGTLVLMLLGAMFAVALVPVVALWPDTRARQWLQAAFVVAFRQPVRTAAVAGAAVALAGAAVEVSPVVVPVCAPLVALAALRVCERQVVAGPDGAPALR